MSRAWNEQKAFSSLEALFSLLAAGTLALAVSALALPSPSEEPLSGVVKFKILNDFLEVRESVALTDGYVAYSGYCLKMELDGTGRVFPANCSFHSNGNIMSTTRIVFENGTPKALTASLWRR